MNKLLLSIIAVFVVAFLVAASPNDGCLFWCPKTPTPTSTDLPTDTPIPTDTPEPTITLTEVLTLTPTPKRIPSKTPTKTILYWTPTPRVTEGDCPTLPCCVPEEDGWRSIIFEGQYEPTYYVFHIEDRTCIWTWVELICWPTCCGCECP